MGKRTRRGLIAVLVLLVLTIPAVTARAAAPASVLAGSFPTPCAPPPAAGDRPNVVVGTVACQELVTHDLGHGVPAPFEYYVPPQCAPAHHRLCPAMYLLHGFGGDYTEMLGRPGTTTSAWIQAETKAPPAGFESEPWNYYDPITWHPVSPALPFILIAPLGRTLPGGYGPAAGLDSYWVNWNPRYALRGDQQRYATPPPQFDHFVTVELPAFVQRFLPMERGRAGTVIAGVSLGGYGSFALGLKHPDLYSSMLSVSGAMNFLFAPAPGAVQPPASSPVPITYEKLPAATGPATSAPLPSQAGTFSTALDAFGDPAADQAYFRGNMPTDLAANGEGIGIDSFVNDMVARRSSDLSDTPFEALVFPMNMDMQADFAVAGVKNTFAIHQGVHSDVYRNAWLRGMEEFAYTSTLAPAPAPVPFSYRSVSTNFTVWGWHFQGHRQNTEFLNLTGVSCRGFTVSGSGSWVVTPPAACHSKSVKVDLGGSAPADQPVSALGRTLTVTLQH